MIPPVGVKRIHRSFIVSVAHSKAVTETRLDVSGQTLVIGCNDKHKFTQTSKYV